jgi:hypothetical protein
VSGSGGEWIGEMCGLLGFGGWGNLVSTRSLAIGVPNIELGFGNWNMRRNVVLRNDILRDEK